MSKVDEGFSQRFIQGLNNAPGVPEREHGRLTWIRDRLEDVTGKKMTVENIRKWREGLVTPRKEAMEALAKIFDCDQAWLALGAKPQGTEREARLRGRRASGAVHFAAGAVILGGISVAFPAPGDRDSEDGVDFFAIVGGEQRRVAVSIVVKEGDKLFARPTNSDVITDVAIIYKDLRSAPRLYIVDYESLKASSEVSADFLQVSVAVNDDDTISIAGRGKREAVDMEAAFS